MFSFVCISLFPNSYVWQEVKDGKWGSREENGDWNGIVGEVLRGVSIKHPTHLCEYQSIYQEFIKTGDSVVYKQWMIWRHFSVTSQWMLWHHNCFNTITSNSNSSRTSTTETTSTTTGTSTSTTTRTVASKQKAAEVVAAAVEAAIEIVVEETLQCKQC